MYICNFDDFNIHFQPWPLCIPAMMLNGPPWLNKVLFLLLQFKKKTSQPQCSEQTTNYEFFRQKSPSRKPSRNSPHPFLPSHRNSKVEDRQHSSSHVSCKKVSYDSRCYCRITSLSYSHYTTKDKEPPKGLSRRKTLL